MFTVLFVTICHILATENVFAAPQSPGEVIMNGVAMGMEVIQQGAAMGHADETALSTVR